MMDQTHLAIVYITSHLMNPLSWNLCLGSELTKPVDRMVSALIYWRTFRVYPFHCAYCSDHLCRYYLIKLQTSCLALAIGQPPSTVDNIHPLPNRNTVPPNPLFRDINTLLWRHPIVLTVDSNLRIHSFIYESTVDSEQRIDSFSMGNSTHDDW